MTEPFSAVAAAVAEIKVVAGTVPVRGYEPDPGDQLGPGEFVAWIRVRLLDATPHSFTPIRDTTLSVQCYSTTDWAAEQLGMKVEAVFRGRGARKSAGRLGIWHSRVLSSSPDHDPDTKQPLWQLVVSYPTTTLEVS